MDDRRRENIYEFYLRNIVHTMKQIQDEKLIPYDITNQQARLLGDIHQQLQNESDICQKDLERVMRLRGSSITSLLQGLERKGFIFRSTGDQDGRTKKLGITSKGIALIDEMESVFQNTEKQFLQGMTVEDKENFQRLLKLAYENIKLT